MVSWHPVAELACHNLYLYKCSLLQKVVDGSMQLCGTSILTCAVPGSLQQGSLVRARPRVNGNLISSFYNA
jgi:hypothetical protein